MKKFHYIALLWLAFAIQETVSAQEIYNFVLENATRTANSPTSSFAQSRIAQFKRTTLTYIKIKALDSPMEVSGQSLDNQAFFLTEFINYYFREVLSAKRLSPEKKAELTEVFQNASRRYPLFEEDDTTLSEAYMNEPNHLTPFSLNTDWQKAHNAVKQRLAEKR